MISLEMYSCDVKRWMYHIFASFICQYFKDTIQSSQVWCSMFLMEALSTVVLMYYFVYRGTESLGIWTRRRGWGEEKKSRQSHKIQTSEIKINGLAEKLLQTEMWTMEFLHKKNVTEETIMLTQYLIMHSNHLKCHLRLDCPISACKLILTSYSQSVL